MSLLGNGLGAASRHEDALSARKAELAMTRRLCTSESSILMTQGNLANTYSMLGRFEEAMLLRRDVYSGFLRINGEQHEKTVLTANNYAASLYHLQRFEEAKALLRKVMPVARRVLGDNHTLTLDMICLKAVVLASDDGSTVDDLREAVTTLEDTERITRRVLGGAHPTTVKMERALQAMRATLAAREGDDVSAVRAALDAMKAT